MVPLLLCAIATVPSEKIAMIRKRGRRVGFGLFMAGSSTCKNSNALSPEEESDGRSFVLDLKPS
jgi:hypothetical protein